MSENMKPCLCPGCGKDAERIVPSTLESVFHQDVTGPVPQNTGISAIDADIDRAIGKSSETGWKAHVERVAEKKRILSENPEASGYDLTETPDGDFEVMPKDKRGFQDRALEINTLAVGTLKKEALPKGDGK
jgi:hypothetical protein